MPRFGATGLYGDLTNGPRDETPGWVTATSAVACPWQRRVDRPPRDGDAASRVRVHYVGDMSIAVPGRLRSYLLLGSAPPPLSGLAPTEVVTDAAPPYPRVPDALVPASVVITGLALRQYLRRSHYVLAIDAHRPSRLAAAFRRTRPGAERRTVPDVDAHVDRLMQQCG
jgi:hypothetical protein